MAVEGNGGTNGYIRWRDLSDVEARLRAERTEQLLRQEHTIHERLEKAHRYHTQLADGQNMAIRSVADRVDAVESILDQQRGARNLVYALIGTNAILAIATGILIVDFFLHL
jgi:hypothetical protein